MDLRPWLQEIPCNHEHIIGDFCDIAPTLLGQFDGAYSLSAIEHFGLGTYKDRDVPVNLHLDVVAGHFLRAVLKPGGVCWVTVPCGRQDLVNLPHWRVYSLNGLDRIIQTMHLEWTHFFTSGSAVIDGKEVPSHQRVMPLSALRYSGDPPHVTVLMRMHR